MDVWHNIDFKFKSMSSIIFQLWNLLKIPSMPIHLLTETIYSIDPIGLKILGTGGWKANGLFSSF